MRAVLRHERVSSQVESVFREEKGEELRRLNCPACPEPAASSISPAPRKPLNMCNSLYHIDIVLHGADRM